MLGGWWRLTDLWAVNFATWGLVLRLNRINLLIFSFFLVWSLSALATIFINYLIFLGSFLSWLDIFGLGRGALVEIVWITRLHCWHCILSCFSLTSTSIYLLVLVFGCCFFADFRISLIYFRYFLDLTNSFIIAALGGLIIQIIVFRFRVLLLSLGYFWNGVSLVTRWLFSRIFALLGIPGSHLLLFCTLGNLLSCRFCGNSLDWGRWVLVGLERLCGRLRTLECVFRLGLIFSELAWGGEGTNGTGRRLDISRLCDWALQTLCLLGHCGILCLVRRGLTLARLLIICIFYSRSKCQHR